MKVDVVADVSLLSAEEGGRDVPAPDRFLACIMVVEGRLHSCRILDTRGLRPGDTGRRNIAFLNPEEAMKGLVVGGEYELREMGKTGTAVIVEIKGVGA